MTHELTSIAARDCMAVTVIRLGRCLMDVLPRGSAGTIIQAAASSSDPSCTLV
jgi:hypothetical protein